MVRTEVREIEHNKVDYIHVRTPNNKATGLMAIGDIKFLIDGVPNITITKGSYKYGSEMQFRILASKSQKIREKIRHPSEWNTVEINMPFEVGKELVEKMNEVIKANS